MKTEPPPSRPPRRARAKCARMGHPLSETFEPSVLQAFLRHSCWEENPGRACWFAEKKTSSEKLEPALALPTGVCSTATLGCAPICDSRRRGTGRGACATCCAPIFDSRCSGTGRSACAAGCAPICDSKRRAQAGVPVCATFYTKLRPKKYATDSCKVGCDFPN